MLIEEIRVFPQFSHPSFCENIPWFELRSALDFLEYLVNKYFEIMKISILTHWWSVPCRIPRRICGKCGMQVRVRSILKIQKPEFSTPKYFISTRTQKTMTRHNNTFLLKKLLYQKHSSGLVEQPFKPTKASRTNFHELW